METQLSMQNDYQDALLRFKQAHPHEHPRPVGWYRFFASDGKQYGYGFYCAKCHLIVEPNVQEVRHCGKVETMPSLFRRIVNLAKYQVPKKLLLL